jgi:pyridinium-3,5-biscarboxylic acid mononucleotide sulfurtransferase
MEIFSVTLSNITLEQKEAIVRSILREMGGVVIAFSGGVDSSLMAVLAREELGDRAVAITAVSPSVAASELAEARALASQFGIEHRQLDSNELQDPRYAENSPLRCYWCKHETYQLLVRQARELGLAGVVDGNNFDDTRSDDRPGRKAAEEYGVRSPFVEAKMGKNEIREIARRLGLPNWDKPAKACLASRLPFGTPVTAEALHRIEQAEEILCRLGLRQYRVRHYKDTARIEVPPSDFANVLEHKDEILAGFVELGYRFVTLDLAGFRSGNMHAHKEMKP